MKFPLVRRKTHDTIVAELKLKANYEYQNCIRRMARQSKKHEEEIREKIEPMVKKFLRVQAWRTDLDFQRYRISTDMDTGWVENCLMHGNSQMEIEYLCHMIGEQVARELEPILRTRNFKRVPKDQDEQRRIHQSKQER